MASTITADNGVTTGSAGLKQSADNTGILTLQTTTAGGTATAALTVNTSQNVGIGTSSPAYKLDVQTAAGRFQVRDLGGSSLKLINSTTGGNIGIDSAGGITLIYANGTETARFDASGNLGLGVTPSAWGSFKALQIGGGTYNGIASSNSYLLSSANAYFDGSAFKYISSAAASTYTQNGGAHYWNIATSGTAGNAISFTQAMTLDASGNVGIGTTSQNERLRVNSSTAGQARLTVAYADSVISYFGSYSGIVGSGNATDVMLSSANVLAFGSGGTTERARIDSSGNLGLGVTPSTILDIGANNNTPKTISLRYSTVPMYMSSTFDGSVGLATISLNTYNTSSGSTSWSGFSNTGYASSAIQLACSSISDIRFLTASGANTAPTERARIDSSGNLLVGTTSAAETSNVGVKILPTGYVYAVSSASTGASEGLVMYSTGAGAYRFYCTWAGQIYATNTTITGISDQRLKENIRDLDDGLDVVMALKPRKFDWKEGKGADIKNARGFIAQEFEQVLPDMVEEWKDPAPEGEEPYKAVNANLIPTLVKAIQELKAEFDAYKATHP